MKNDAQSSADRAIDVVGDYDYSTQDNAYNEKYIKWRKNTKNPFAFNYKMNPKESVFRDSRGFESTSTLADAEKKSITNIMRIIGVAMLITIAVDSVLSKLLVLLFELLGFNIHTSLLTKGYFGGSSEVVGMYVNVNLLKIAVPTVYMYLKLKLPPRVAVMSKLHSPVEVINSIALTLMACTVVSLPAAYSSDSESIFAFFQKTGSEDVSLWKQDDFVLYVVFSVIILPIVSELFFRGAVFAALRQFGDGFAIAVTAATACLLTRDFTEMPAAVLISIVASVGMLRSGTIFTAFIVRVIYRMYLLALIMLENDTSLEMLVYRNTFMLCAFIIGAVTFIVIYLFQRSKNKHHFAVYKSQNTAVMRYSAAFRTFPYSVMAAICILEAAIALLELA